MADTVEIEAELVHESEGAYQIWDGQTYNNGFGEGAHKVVWVPKSLTEYDGDSTFTMPEWLAKDKGLI